MRITNAFSIQMLPDNGGHVSFDLVTKIQAKEAVSYGFTSCVGHADTAAVVSDDLGIDANQNRVGIKLQRGDKILVAQLKGGRLPEGATTLPEGFSIEYFLVSVL